jgi:hypothetical protein
VLQIRDPDPEWKKSGSGIKELRNNFLGFDSDPDALSGIFLTLDPGRKNQIRDKHAGSAPVLFDFYLKLQH